MTAEVIDGKAFAAQLRERVGVQAAKFEEQTGRKAGLAVVLVGEDPASQVYVRSKHKATVAANMESFEHRLPADTSDADLLALVERLNNDAAVDGVLVQLPLPDHIDATKVIERNGVILNYSGMDDPTFLAAREAVESGDLEGVLALS